MTGTDDDVGGNGKTQLARRYLAALAVLDLEALRDCYREDAVVWHNVDRIERSVEQTLRRAVALSAEVVERRAVIRRIDVLADGVLLCLDVEVTAVSGRVTEFSAAIVLTMVEGRISRSEEYVDSRQIAQAFRQ